MSDDPYYGGYNVDVLKLIPPNAKSVLEIGCGEGKLAEMYRRINPGVDWVGVEKNTAAAVDAVEKKRCDDVINIDLDHESATDYLFSDDPFDCLIFGDVLEHLREPERVLEEFVPWLKPGGIFIASIPNVQHWSIIQMLLNGEWEYQDAGLMDRTHLRWFTLKSARRMFDQAGLHVFAVRARLMNNDGHAGFIEDWFPERYRLEQDRDVIEFKQSTQVYQHVIRGLNPDFKDVPPDPGSAAYRKTVWPLPTTMLVRYLVGCHACSHVRCKEPGQFLMTIPGVTTEVHGAQLPEEVKAIGELNWTPEGYDHKIVVLQRLPLTGEVLAMLEEAGWTIILEIDDMPGAMSDNLPAFAAENGFVIRHCHAIQTTTATMKKTIEGLAYLQEVQVIPNQIAELDPFPEEKFEPSDRKVRVFFGAINRPDWKPLIDDLNRLIANRDNVEFVVVNDPEFFDALDTDRKQSFPYLVYADYRKVLRSCDIALLPLEDNAFNGHKSDLKFLECAAEGVVVVASDTVYRGSVASRFGMLGGLYRTNGQAMQILESFIASSVMRKDVARKAYDYVKESRMLRTHYEAIYDWYLKIAQMRQLGVISLPKEEVVSE